jgi:amino acid adenylation domain-containing protein
MSRTPGGPAQDRRDQLRRLLSERLERAAEDSYPATANQHAIWSHQRLYPHSNAYHLIFSARTGDDVDADRLAAAYRRLVRRHECLRCGLSDRTGTLRVHVADDESGDFAVTEVGDKPDLQGHVDAEAARPFDLDVPGLSRLRVLRANSGQTVLLLVVHHTVADMWSFGVIVRELFLAYEGQGLSDMPTPASFREFAATQARWVSSAAGQKALDYWTERLSGDHPTAALGSGAAGRGLHPVAYVHDRMGRRRTARLRQMAAAHDATLYAALLACVTVFLSKRTRLPRFVFGSVVAGRNDPRHDGTVGYFANPLVVAANASDNMTMRELLAATVDTLLADLSQANLPFPMVTAARTTSAMADNPLRTSLAYESMPSQTRAPMSYFGNGGPDTRLALGGCELEPFPVGGRHAEAEITCFVEEADGQLYVAAQYATDVFDEQMVRDLLGQFAHMVDQILDNPTRRLREYCLLNPSSQQAALARSGVHAEPDTLDGTVLDEIRAWARQMPDRIALATDDTSCTYAELVARVEAASAALGEHGYNRGSRVGVCADGLPEFVVALLAVLDAGLAYVPLDPTYPTARLDEMIADSRMKILVTQDGVPLGSARVPALALPDLHPVTDRKSPTPTVHPDELACVIYTSGSTGRPKGVLIEHRGLLHLARAQRQMLEELRPGGQKGAGESRVVLQFASPSFDAATWEWLMALTGGHTLVLVPREMRRPGPDLTATINRFNVTTITMPPSALALLEPDSVPSLTEIFSAGEACPPGLLARWAPGRHFVNAYGPTEVTVCASATSPLATDQPITLGQPLRNAQMYVLDDYLHPVPTGVVGQLFLGGSGLSRGYLGKTRETARRFLPNPFSRLPGTRIYASGDLAFRDAAGAVHYVGRSDDQVKVRGFRVELGEVEQALATHPQVREAAVVAVDAGTERARLVGFVTLASTPRPDGLPTKLTQHLTASLPPHMVPNTIEVLERLPVTAHGKVDRTALRTAARSAARSPVSQPPRTAIETALCRIWGEELELEPVGVDDDFFQCGGTSLVAMRMLCRVEQELGVRTSAESLFENPTVRAFASTLEKTGHRVTTIPRHEPAHAPAALSFAQQRLWFLHEFDPDSDAYHVVLRVSLHGDLDYSALDRALTDLLRRHPALRTTLDLSTSPPTQVVQAAPPLSLARVDLTRADDTSQATEQAVARLAREPFDLQRSAFRAAVVRVSESHHELLLVMHHIVCDGTSATLILHDLGRLYTAACADQTATLPDVAVGPVDFAEWQRQRLESGDLDQAINDWLATLDDTDLELHLPRRPVTTGASGEPGRSSTTMGSQLATSVNRICTRVSATPAMVFLAAYELVLGRWSGQRSFCIGMPIAGRGRPELEHAVGMFVNTLPIVTDLSEAGTFDELVTRVKGRLARALANQDAPFEKLVERLSPARSLEHAPVFQVMFNMVNFPSPEVAFADLAVEVHPPRETSAKYDLTLYVSGSGPATRIDLVYNTGAFSPTMAELFMDHLCAVLRTAADAGDLDLSVLTSRPWAPAPPATTTPAAHAPEAALPEYARSHPDRPAVVGPRGHYTFGQVEQQAVALATALTRAGVHPGDPVAVLAERTIDLPATLTGVLRARATLVLIEADHPAGRVVSALQASGARVAVGMPPPSRLVAAIAAAGLPILVSDRSGMPVLDTRPATADRTSPDGSRPFVAGPGHVLFTSGTTGTPRAVYSPIGPLTHYLDWATGRFDLRATDRFAMASGVAHDPILRDVLLPVALGATLCVPDEQTLADPDLMLEWLAQERISVLHLTPSRGSMLVAARPGVLPELRFVFLGGEPLSADLARDLAARCPNATIVNCYGTTETPQVAAYHVVDPASTTVPLGRGIDGTQLVVARDGQPARPGELGEVWIRSRHLAYGYLLNEPDHQGEAFIADPCGDPGLRVYRTGDLARVDEHGQIQFVGRKDRQLSVRGHRVEPAEIESIIQRLAAGSTCLVVPVSAIGSPRPGLVAYVASPRPIDVAALRAGVARALPAHLVPTDIVIMDRLPMTTRGKLDVRSLPTPTQDRETDLPPETGLQKAVAAIWREVLGVDGVGIRDNFFDLGGHSMLVVDVQRRLRSRVAADVTVVDLFRFPTVESLARHLAGEAHTPDERGRTRRGERRRALHRERRAQ